VALPGAGLAAENLQEPFPASSLPPSAPSKPFHQLLKGFLSDAFRLPPGQLCPNGEAGQAGSGTWEDAPFILPQGIVDCQVVALCHGG